MLSFLCVRQCVSWRFNLSDGLLKSFKTACGLKRREKWQAAANKRFVFINNRLLPLFWWEAVKHEEHSSVLGGSERGGVWPLSAVISAARQWVVLTAELAWMLSHVLVRPFRVRGRTSLLSASITSSRRHKHTHKQTHTHTVQTLRIVHNTVCALYAEKS